ncbi:putative reverse transcriptase [Trichonephila clavata]|uniref:Putative reverse transcriptase n=1 Tax=Trichonephila clavata TaxID=2740835 RepID=A0A8X6FFR6_TRICU|nr:putative reverse transcriptase [Trichonephila clavata]
MIVNTSKRVFQVFTLNTKPKVIQLFYGDYQLQRTQEATYLGIVLDSRLSWNKQASKNKIETVQNNALRIITGGAFSKLIQAMQLQANIEPLTFRRKMVALKLIERLIRHGDFGRNYNPADYSPCLRVENFLRHLSPACYNLDLVLPVNKRSCIDTELRMTALATVGERSPEKHWLHVYMDDSAAGDNHNAGVGVYSRYFRLSRAVGANCTNYDGELSPYGTD